MNNKKEIFFKSLGTNCSFIIYGKNDNYAIEAGKVELKRIEEIFSVYNKSSEIGYLNEISGDFFKLSKESFWLIDKSIFYSNITEGFFDITIRPLVKLWSIGKDNFNIPKDREIKKTKNLVNYKAIELNKSSLEIRLHKNQELDLGAIAKGYAADKVKDIFINLGITSAIINLGGNIALIGSKESKEPWTIGIQNPFGERGDYIGTIRLIDKSIVTSGCYERFSIRNNELYSHIINPKTGYPISGEILSISIISHKSIDGDGLSTGLYILGIEKSLEILNRLNFEGIFITKNFEVILTNGIKDKFILTNEEFKIISK